MIFRKRQKPQPQQLLINDLYALCFAIAAVMMIDPKLLKQIKNNPERLKKYIQEFVNVEN